MLVVGFSTTVKTPTLQYVGSCAFVGENRAQADLQWQKRAHNRVQSCLMQYCKQYRCLTNPAGHVRTRFTSGKHSFTYYLS